MAEKQYKTEMEHRDFVLSKFAAIVTLCIPCSKGLQKTQHRDPKGKAPLTRPLREETSLSPDECLELSRR